MSETTQTTTKCPECDAAITIEAGTLVNEILPCEECGAELEVTGLDPVQLALAPEIEEDWGE